MRDGTKRAMMYPCSRLGAGAGRAKLRVLGPALAAAITAVVDII